LLPEKTFVWLLRDNWLLKIYGKGNFKVLWFLEIKTSGWFDGFCVSLKKNYCRGRLMVSWLLPEKKKYCRGRLMGPNRSTLSSLKPVLHIPGCDDSNISHFYDKGNTSRFSD